jgi:hypothetical protein
MALKLASHLNGEQFHNLYSLSNIIRGIKLSMVTCRACSMNGVDAKCKQRKMSEEACSWETYSQVGG